MSRDDEVLLLGFRLLVLRGVFHPSLFFSSKMLGRWILTQNLHGKAVLDMGTGSGILGLCAARAGANVTAVDVDDQALRCASENVSRNGLEDRIKVIQSDLFAGIPPSATFDLVIWNPPFYRRDPATEQQKAWNAGTGFEVVTRFAADVSRYLAPGGKVVMILTSDVDAGEFFSGFRGFRRTTMSAARRGFERLTIHALTLSSFLLFPLALDIFRSNFLSCA